MDSRDEDLTIENVDERVEELLLFQVSQSPATMPLAHLTHDLHNLYEDERRLKAIWERVNSLATVANADYVPGKASEPTLNGSFQAGKKAGQAKSWSDVGSLDSMPPLARKRPQPWCRWRNLAVGLAAALLLVAILALPTFSLIFRSTPTLGSQPPTPVGNRLAMKKYACQYFTIQYPADWALSDTTIGDSALKTVHFHPTATSAVAITAVALPASGLSAQQLLHTDPDTQRGTLVSTNTVMYNGIPWSVDLINLISSTQAPLGKLEIAYSNQNAPYKIEFSAPLDLFASYAAVFTTMLRSFSPQAQPVITPAPTLPPTITPAPTKKVVGMKQYSNQYFNIQYPSNWIIANVTTGNGYLQTVQFRPSTQSATFVNVSVLHNSLLPAYLLLQLDPDVGLGALLSTSTVTYRGVPWSTAMVKVAGSAQAQPSQLEIAYSNQKMPYRIECSAPPDQFAASNATFNAFFASFDPAN